MSSYDEDREADGAAKEREAVIAYLRAQLDMPVDDREPLAELCDAIERGEHVKPAIERAPKRERWKHG